MKAFDSPMDGVAKPQSGRPSGATHGQKGIEQGDDTGSIKHGPVPSPWSSPVISGKGK